MKAKGVIINMVLILIVIALSVLPLVMLKNAEFTGADGEAVEAITELNSAYEPWFTPLFEPNSSEVESLLFALQAAVGSGVLCYCLGYLKGRKRKEEINNDLH